MRRNLSPVRAARRGRHPGDLITHQSGPTGPKRPEPGVATLPGGNTDFTPSLTREEAARRAPPSPETQQPPAPRRRAARRR